MKKCLSLLLTVMLLLACLPALAADGDFSFNAKECMINKYTGTNMELVIPEELDGTPVRILNQNALSRIDVTSVTTPASLQILCGFNFYNTASMTSVTLNEGLVVMLNSCFMDCDALESITIPASVRYIAYKCFQYCDVLTDVTFLGKCPVLEEACFKSAHSDLVIRVPDDELENYIAALPAGLNIQPSGQNAVVVEPEMDESLYTFKAETGTITGYNGNASYLRIPAQIGGVDVKSIGSDAFSFNLNTAVVEIPEGVEHVEKRAFQSNRHLIHVVLPSTLKTIGECAFQGSAMTMLELNDGLESIGKQAFMNSNLDSLVIPDSVRTIEEEAFFRARLSRVTVGAGVETIGSKAFSECILKEITLLTPEMPEIGAEAFTCSMKEAALNLADGITKETYQAYVDMMAEQYPVCVVNQPALKPEFPVLDAEAGAPFIGLWHGVAARDGEDYYNAVDLGLMIDITLNADGSGFFALDGDGDGGCWYAENGTAVFAPILEEGGDPYMEEALSFTMDENGRMNVDLAGIFLICEKEGVTYETSAIPERPWPELNADNGKYFVGSWEAVAYTMDDETYDAAFVGPMMLTLYDDGTAAMDKDGETNSELRWYADFGTAYVGPTVNTAAKVVFDGNGNIEMEQEGMTVLLKPYVEAPEVPVIEGADELLGEWLDDVGNKLTVVNDGNLTVTYASDGYMREMKWDAADGSAMVTEGLWEGCPITLENGIVTITNGEGIFQIFSADGDLSAYYGEEENYEMPEAVPVGEVGEPYYGAWKLESMGGMDAASMGMSMVLTLNPDGTASMYDGFESSPGVWTVENGAAMVMGSALTINSEGKLIMPQDGMDMIFVKAEGESAASDEMCDEEAMELLMAMMGVMEETEETVSDDGEISDDEALMLLMAMLGEEEEAAETVTDDGEISDEEALMLLMAMMGAMEEEQEEPADETAAPFVGVKFELTGAVVQGITLTAEQLNCAGDYVIFNADGSADLVMSGIPIQTLGWKQGIVNVLGTDYEGVAIDYYGTPYNFAFTETGLLMDYFGMLRTYSAE